ncbi:MAG: cupredoxin domain-containing protein [Chthoniobacterales bacterium]
MKIFLAPVAVAAFSFVLLPASAQEKTTAEKTSEVWEKTKETTKEVSREVVDTTKKAVARVEAAIDQPDADAHKVDVTITDEGVQMPQSLRAGKTAFVVKNSGKEKHNFEVAGPELEKSFWLAIAPGASKTMQVDLKPGSYEAECKLHEGKEPKVRFTVK